MMATKSEGLKGCFKAGRMMRNAIVSMTHQSGLERFDMVSNFYRFALEQCEREGISRAKGRDFYQQGLSR